MINIINKNKNVLVVNVGLTKYTKIKNIINVNT